jgi:hypothetical protein
VVLGGCIIPDPFVNVACRHRWFHEAGRKLDDES